MPMQQKGRRRRRRDLQVGLSRRSLDEEGASLSGSLVDSDCGSRVDGGSPPPGLPDEPVMSSTEPRYHEILASRLAQLELPVGNDGSDFAGLSCLPSNEILEALARKSFHDDELRAARLEYECHKFLSKTRERDRDSGEPDSAVVDLGSNCTEPDDHIFTKEAYMSDCEVLRAHKTEIDTYTELDQEQTNRLHIKRALYLIKAALLLKGMPVDELDDAELEHKYPQELIVKNNYFFHYEEDSFFSWYFDFNLCYKESLTDYQRLVLLNDGDYDYKSWSTYQAFYSTPEADRDYLNYWEMIVKKIKWFEQYLLIDQSSIEWTHIRSKAMFQAKRIAVKFPNLTLELAALCFNEYICRTRTNLRFVKDIDGIFYEIWIRVNKDRQLSFRDALQQVYDAQKFTAHNRRMKYALNYSDSKMELVFGRCTKGLSDTVPPYKARELIAQEIRWTRGSSGTYEQYARKKLKIAELIGLIPKENIAAV